MIRSHRTDKAWSAPTRGLLKLAAVVFLAILLLPEPIVMSPLGGVALARPATEPTAITGTPVAVETNEEQPATRGAAALPPRAASPQQVAMAVAGTIPAGGAAALQAEPGRLSGRIFDQTGAVIPGVAVQLQNTTGTVMAQSVTNASGAYVLAITEPGRYSVVARLPGFQIHTRTLDIPEGQTVTHNAVLRLAEVSTVVEVSAGKPATGAEPEGGPVRIGGDVSQPNLIYSPRPQYPAWARASNVQGPVVLRAIIGSDGTIVAVQPHPSEGTDNLELIRAAMDAVRQWRYRPAFLNGMPIETWSTITVNFSLVDY